ncbi:flagellar biosynthesis regulator FlhF [Clostridia bacterium]|nr:flagellar biosynthesis regulator FlhF [Clostridia bacterium]
MKIKKYTAGTEAEAIELVKADLGLNALILNIKKVQPKGMLHLFKKAEVEVTAAYEEKTETATDSPRKSLRTRAQKESVKEEEKPAPERDVTLEREIALRQAKISLLEKELGNKEALLKKAAGLISVSSIRTDKTRRYENNLLQVFFETLIERGVTDEIAELLLKDVSLLPDIDQTDLSMIVRVVYNSIIEILGEPVPLKDKDRAVIFLGPTGVGKTTTIAKLSSKFVLSDNVKVGLITADTYRIAAVQQLKVYAEILGIDIGIVYNAQDLSEILPKMKKFANLILIDTAGRSHRNPDAIAELTELLAAAPDAEKYLVLSLTTKFEDLLSIINAYSEITDFKLIFTKADETMCLGSVLNICYLTKKGVSYITNGQNVPDDISVLDPAQISKALLGLEGTI